MGILKWNFTKLGLTSREKFIEYVKPNIKYYILVLENNLLISDL